MQIARNVRRRGARKMYVLSIYHAAMIFCSCPSAPFNIFRHNYNVCKRILKYAFYNHVIRVIKYE